MVTDYIVYTIYSSLVVLNTKDHFTFRQVWYVLLIIVLSYFCSADISINLVLVSRWIQMLLVMREQRRSPHESKIKRIIVCSLHTGLCHVSRNDVTLTHQHTTPPPGGMLSATYNYKIHPNDSEGKTWVLVGIFVHYISPHSTGVLVLRVLFANSLTQTGVAIRSTLFYLWLVWMEIVTLSVLWFLSVNIFVG